MRRSSGILMHVTSLPSPYGIGSLGKEAMAFADFLAASGQRYWQMLPHGPTGYGDSPYQCFSTFAGNPYFIDLDMLVQDGLLTQEEIYALPFGSDARKVDFGVIYQHRAAILRAAFVRGYARDEERVQAFTQENADWLPDYALFMALKSHFGMRAWLEWEDAAIMRREPAAMEQYRTLLSEECRYHSYLQFLFHTQWLALREYCNARDIRLIGDLPIYVSLDSADVWANPALFQLAQDGTPTHVAGVPPDYFSSTGQLWGNPLYDWEALRETGYAWWMRRVASAEKLYDVLRIDHFRGFASYWSVPYGEQTAIQGAWQPGPGMAFIHALQEHFKCFPIIAEDLGILTEDVHQLRQESGYPGMKVLQFAFDDSWRSLYLPHQYEKHCVCYTGTHDNNTVSGFLRENDPMEVAFAVEYLGLNVAEGLHWGFIRGGMASAADLFICQMQDVLALPLRMNTPGTLFCNWQWRMLPGEIPEEAVKRLARYTAMYGRSKP